MVTIEDYDIFMSYRLCIFSIDITTVWSDYREEEAKKSFSFCIDNLNLTVMEAVCVD